MKNNELINTGSAFGKLQDFDLSLALSDELAGPEGPLAAYGLVADPELAATQTAVADEATIAQ